MKWRISPNLCKLSTSVMIELNLSESIRVISSLSSAIFPNKIKQKKKKQTDRQTNFIVIWNHLPLIRFLTAKYLDRSTLRSCASWWFDPLLLSPSSLLTLATASFFTVRTIDRAAGQTLEWGSKSILSATNWGFQNPNPNRNQKP